MIRPGEVGRWVAECPSLPGRVSRSETREAAIANWAVARFGGGAIPRQAGLAVDDLINLP